MKLRIPLIVAVVGALLVGGATTGSTRASWTEQIGQVGDGITAGTMNFTLETSGSLANLDQVGTSQSTATFVVTDTGTGKNLVQRITASVASSPAGVTAYVAAGTACSAITSTSGYVDKVPSEASRLATYCVRVVSSTSATSGNVTLSLSGAQRPSGWSAPMKTVTMPVVVNAPAAPSAPTITCSANQSDPNARTFTWSNLGAGVTYQLYRQGPPPAPTFTPLGSPISTTTHSESTLGNGQTSMFKIKSIKNGIESVFSSTVTISRNGSSANYNCSVTP